MARYKPIDTQPKLLAVDLAAQLLPGTFEHALHHLLEHAIDLTPFDARYRNDATGAPAYPPGMLIRVVLFAYSRGLVSSRASARACEEHVTLIALSGYSRPHCTTIAHFGSALGDQIAPLFAAVLAVCDRQGLIGRERFAIDGGKLPGNASKHRSGTRADFERQAATMERAAEQMLARHRSEDAAAVEPTHSAKDTARRERLVRDAAALRSWLERNPADRRGTKGAIRKSNRTDNESAKMATSKSVLQGYTGVATVDATHQIIVDAQAHGVGAEQALLLPLVAATAALRTPDPLHDKSKPARKPLTVFGPDDFTDDPVARTCGCPAGKSLYRKGARNVTGEHVGEHFRGAKRDCGPCALRTQCLRTPETTPVRTVAFFHGRVSVAEVNHSARMRERIDSPAGRVQYAQRFAAVEPVFGNLRANKRLDRFTLRGRQKVDTQWKLYCLVHNIEKLAHAGYAA